MTGDELTDWLAFYDLEPFGEETKQRAMLIATAMSNGMYTGKVKWERLMPVRPEVIRQTPEQIARALSGTFDGLRKQAKKPKTTKKTKRHG